MKNTLSEIKPLESIPSTGKVNYEDVKDTIMKSLDDIREEDKVNHLRLYYDMGVAMSKASMDCIVLVLQSARARELNAFTTTVARMNKAEQKQLIFNIKEAMKITDVKSKTTMLKYVNNGIIKADKNAKGEWTFRRKDLADYLGVEDIAGYC